MLFSGRLAPFFLRWILPIGILGLTFSFDTGLPDPFHAWRWTLLALVAALGLLSLALAPLAPGAAPARLPLLLAGGALASTLLSLAVARNPGEALWQAAQSAAWTAWLLYALASGAGPASPWVLLRRLGVASALLGGGFAVLDYWGFWNPGRPLGLGPGGLHGNRNLLASFHFLLAPWILWACLEERGFRRAAAAGAWIVTAYVLAIAQSRAVWLGAIVMAAACAGLVSVRGGRAALPPKPRGRLAAGLAVPLLAAFLFHGQVKPATDGREGSLERAASVVDPAFASNAQRLALWKKTLTLIGENPWLGVGPGHWKVALPSTGMAGLLWPDMSLTETRPYNDWLWVAAETGIPGGLLWMGLWAAALAAGFRAARRERGSEAFPPLLFTAGLAGFGAVAALDFPRERPEHMAWYALALAFLFRSGISGVTLAASRAGTPAIAGIARIARIAGNAGRQRWAGPAFAAAALVAAAGAAFAWARWRAEAEVQALLEAQRAKAWPEVIAIAGRLHPLVCPLNPAGSPMAWHEGIARHRLGDREGAERAFLHSLERHPWHLPTLHNLAVCRLAAGDTTGALRRLDQALAISPAFSEAALGRALLSLKRGEPGPARKALDGIEPRRRTDAWQSLDRLVAADERTLP